MAIKDLWHLLCYGSLCLQSTVTLQNKLKVQLNECGCSLFTVLHNHYSQHQKMQKALKSQENTIFLIHNIHIILFTQGHKQVLLFVGSLLPPSGNVLHLQDRQVKMFQAFLVDSLLVLIDCTIYQCVFFPEIEKSVEVGMYAILQSSKFQYYSIQTFLKDPVNMLDLKTYIRRLQS